MQQRSRWWLLLALYVGLLHALVVVQLLKPQWSQRWRQQLVGRSSEVPGWYADVHGFYRRQDRQLAAGQVLFLGDSHVESLAVNMLSPDAVNFGIGGDTSAALLRRVMDYQSVRHARAIVIVIGGNDLVLRDDASILANLRQLLSELPATTPVLLSTILPVDDQANARLQARTPRLAGLATKYAELCAAFPQCRLLDSYRLFVDEHGRMPSIWHEGDGIHLNNAGNLRWRDAIQQALQQLTVAPTP